MSTAVNPLTRSLMTLIAVLAVAGIAVSSVSLQHHYAKSKTAYCDIGETFNCDIVNRSEYSRVGPIPVALIGVLGYAALAWFATVYRSRPDTPKILLSASVTGLIFALYLTYIEGHVLGVWCILCLSSLTLISCITAVSGIVWLRSRTD